MVGGRGPAWGSGYTRSGGNQNRFAALSEQPSREQGSRYDQPQGKTPQQSQGIQRQQTTQHSDGRQQVNWRRTVDYDTANEKPNWPLTCYSHLRSRPGQMGGGPNDVEGDYQFEELRWAQLQAAARNRQAHQLSQEFKAAVNAQRQQLADLAKAGRAPSEGGAPIPSIENYLPANHSLLAHAHSSGLGLLPATPSAQVVGAFGHNVSVAARPSAFAAVPARPGFGHGQGIVFGSEALGRKSAPRAGGYGQPLLGIQGQSTQNSAVGLSAFQPMSVSGPVPGFQALPINTAENLLSYSAKAMHEAAPGAEVPDDEKAWAMTCFQKGMIPDCVPPAKYCV